MIRKCEYFPCHEGMEDCDMCYCLVYPCNIEETGGKYIEGKNGKKIWDCSDCVIVHKKEFLEKIKPIILKQILLSVASCDHPVDTSCTPVPCGNDFLYKRFCNVCKKTVYKSFALEKQCNFRSH